MAAVRYPYRVKYKGRYYAPNEPVEVADEAEQKPTAETTKEKKAPVRGGKTNG